MANHGWRDRISHACRHRGHSPEVDELIELLEAAAETIDVLTDLAADQVRVMEMLAATIDRLTTPIRPTSLVASVSEPIPKEQSP